MTHPIAKSMFVLALAIGSACAVADTLLIDGISADQPTASSRPQAGASMAGVEANYGAPSQRHNAVGEPPITRWDYPSFSVYFEREVVIHSVARR
jgi:hypothetical protein